MLTLTNDLVAIGKTATDKADAIAQAVDLLAAAGKIDPRYGASMMGREKVANTFLGNGIAIPHGLPKDRDLIHDTAIAVVQLPGGVEWGSGERARLVVAIAARSDEHLAVLTNLTDVLGDEAEAEKLATTLDPADIVARLTGQASTPCQRYRAGERSGPVLYRDHPRRARAARPPRHGAGRYLQTLRCRDPAAPWRAVRQRQIPDLAAAPWG